MNVEKIDNMGLKGFLSKEEAHRLYELAREASTRGPCLEIGSYCGKSSAYIGLGCKESGGILFSIDHHEGSEEQQPGQEYFDPELLDAKTKKINTFPIFQEVIHKTGLADTVVPIVSQSVVAARFWNTPISMIFIDGGHTFAAAFSDYNSWVCHLMPNGYLAIHDVFRDKNQGGQAPRCIYNMAVDSGLFEALPMVQTLGILRRSPNGAATKNALLRWDAINL
jgi:predicted O-methyltransferase YrrM